MLRIVFALVLMLGAGPAMATDAGWALLREGGHVVLLRHAMSGGGAEPANFDIEKCATQRNLSERGKQQARKIGALFATRAAPIDRVLSSRWCRCLNTARIAFEAEPEVFEPLDPVKTDEVEKAAQLKAIMDIAAGFAGSDNLVMVTHADVVQALTGLTPREGEAVIVQAEGERLRVLGRIVFN
jgi:phosphohistidine phosphatase SixA